MVPDLDQLPVVDAELRAELEMVGGKELPARLTQMFLDDAQQLRREIAEATETGDSLKAAKAAHRIKGGAAAVGAQRVSRVAQLMEEAGRDGDTPTVGSLLPSLRVELENLRNQL